MSRRRAERWANAALVLYAVAGAALLAEYSPGVAVVWLGLWAARAT